MYSARCGTSRNDSAMSQRRSALQPRWPYRWAALALSVYAACARSGFDTSDPSDVQTSVRDAGRSEGLRRDASAADVPRPREAGASDLPSTDVGRGDVVPLDSGLSDSGVAPGQWRSITAGSFTMGSPASELCHTSSETEHVVTLTRSFELTRTEVTQQEFAAVMGYNPAGQARSGRCDAADCPVESVSWHEAVAYCNRLSTRSGLPTCYTCSGFGATASCTVNTIFAGSAVYGCRGYRLPTDAEWEYAYRGGKTTPYYNGTPGSCSNADPAADAIAWYARNASTRTHPVAQRLVNPQGLFDMAGNVAEWCHDAWRSNLGSRAVTDPVVDPSSDVLRVRRGGAWDDGPARVRASARASFTAANDENTIGFRCARTL